jgi:hypothetical protein
MGVLLGNEPGERLEIRLLGEARLVRRLGLTDGCRET